MVASFPASGASGPGGREEPLEERGAVRFEPSRDEQRVPERYRLAAHDFRYVLRRKARLANTGVETFELRFPSAVVSDTPENNTVHGEYYRPDGAGPFPAAVVLDITSGSQRVSGAEAVYLAQHGVAALCMHMPYYGPRRAPASNRRLLSPDYQRSMDAVRQTVLDVRCAAAWLAERPEVDPARVGIIGTSLGSFLGTLSAEMEPRVSRVAVLLGGGGIVEAYYDDPRAAPFRQLWEALGGDRERLKELIAPGDPLTYAANLKGRKVLIMAGRRDQVVPPIMAERLLQAAGRPEIVWFDCDHFGAALHFTAAMKLVRALFTAPPSPNEPVFGSARPSVTPAGPSGGGRLP